ncbi:MAG: SH3 domain-containing protein [Eubacterium sp.]|nr:SH3 domain-containing protein [Eubacterium sp.]
MKKSGSIILTAAIAMALILGGMGETLCYADTATIYSGTGASVNLRSGAGTDYERVTSIPDGATVEIGALTDGWYEVSYNGYSGYVLAELIQTGSSSSSADTSASTSTDTSSSTDSSTSTDVSTATDSSTEESTDSSVVTTEDGDILINGESYSIDNDFYADDMPSGFTYTAIMLDDESVNAAYSEQLEIYLVHLVDADGNASWFVRDESSDTGFYPYITLGDDESFIIIKDSGEDALDGYTEVELPIDTYGILTGFQEDGGDANHYIIYAISNEGLEGWYILDSSTNTYISSAGMELSSDSYAIEETEEEEETTETVSPIFKKISAVLGFLCVLLLVILIATLIKKSGRSAGYDDDFFGFGDNDEKPSAKSDAKPATKTESKPASKTESKSDQTGDEDDEDFEGDNELSDGDFLDEIDLGIVNSAVEKQNLGRYSKQIKESEENAAEKAASESLRHAAYRNLKVSDKPDNIDIIDLN